MNDIFTHLFAAILVAAMLLEMRTGRIPNWLTLMLPVVFMAALVLTEDRSPLYWQAAQAVGIMVFGMILFALAGAGAGAVKLMTGAALFVPLDKSFGALLVFMAALFVGALVISQVRRFIGAEASRWHVLAKPVLPMSVPIGITGLCAAYLL